MRKYTPEEFDAMVFESLNSIQLLANKHGKTKDEIREAFNRELERRRKKKVRSPKAANKGESKPWKEEELERLVSMLDLGMTAEEIAGALSRNVSSVKHAISYHVHRDRYTPLSDKEKQIIRSMYFDLGKSMKQIAKRTRRSYAMVKRYIKKIQTEMEHERYGT